MKIIYVHGLDSSANSVKGVLLETYCQQYHPNIEVVRPDLNQSPDRVFKRLCGYVEQAKSNHEQALVMGSSLGGYFSTLVSNTMNCPALLLNPSTQPHVSLQRFVNYSVIESIACDDAGDMVIYRTIGGWDLTLRDLDWFSSHKLKDVTNPERMVVIIKSGDELLDPSIAAQFYEGQGVQVDLQEGGDHRMTDFESQLPYIMKRVIELQT